MSARTTAEGFAQLLSRLAAGSVNAALDGAPLATLDVAHRTLTVQLDPLLAAGERRPLLSEVRVGLWSARGVPGALARHGWRVSLRRGEQELVGLGRGTSALTGHVRLDPVALWKLRDRR